MSEFYSVLTSTISACILFLLITTVNAMHAHQEELIAPAQARATAYMMGLSDHAPGNDEIMPKLGNYIPSYSPYPIGHIIDVGHIMGLYPDVGDDEIMPTLGKYIPSDVGNDEIMPKLSSGGPIIPWNFAPAPSKQTSEMPYPHPPTKLGTMYVDAPSRQNTPEPYLAQAPSKQNTEEPYLAQAPSRQNTPEPYLAQLGREIPVYVDAPSRQNTPEPYLAQAPSRQNTPEPYLAQAPSRQNTPEPYLAQLGEIPVYVDAPSKQNTPEPYLAQRLGDQLGSGAECNSGDHYVTGPEAQSYCDPTCAKCCFSETHHETYCIEVIAAKPEMYVDLAQAPSRQNTPEPYLAQAPSRQNTPEPYLAQAPSRQNTPEPYLANRLLGDQLGAGDATGSGDFTGCIDYVYGIEAQKKCNDKACSTCCQYSPDGWQCTEHNGLQLGGSWVPDWLSGWTTSL